MLDSPDAQFAIDAVRRAALLVRTIQSQMVTPALTKEDHSPVTVADFAAQAVVGRLLADAYPNDPLVGEEDAAELRTDHGHAALGQVTQFVRCEFPDATADSVCRWIDTGGGDAGGRFWTIDPIDGTKGFLRKEQYAVALALIESGRVRLAALGCPNLTDGAKLEVGGAGSVIVAAAGEGTWTLPIDGEDGPRQLGVSGCAAPAAARLLRSVESGHTNAGKIGEFVAALGIAADPVCLDSQAKYAVLAAGAGDALLRLLSPSRPDYREKIWDQAAGSLVVEEAGGRVTDLDGRPLDFTQGRTLAANRGICATNGKLHEAMLAGLRQVAA